MQIGKLVPFHDISAVGTLSLPPPSPTSTNGAQYSGRASCGQPLAIRAAMDRRRASARPILGFCAQLGEGADGELYRGVGIDIPVRHQQRAGFGVEERARQADSASASPLSPAAVLQAERTTQLASSSRLHHLGGGEQPIVLLQLGCASAVSRQSEQQHQLRVGLQDRLALAGQVAVGGEVHAK